MLIRQIFSPADDESLPQAAPASDAWRLKDIVGELRRGWLLLLASALGGLLIACVLLAQAVPIYTARLIVAPVEAARDDGALRQMALLLPGRADMQGPTDMAEFLVLVRSERLAQLLDARHRLRERLFAYDPARQAFVPPGGMIAGLRGWLHGLFGLPGWSPPTVAALTDRLAALLKVEETDQGGIYELRFGHRDPAFAADLLAWVHAGADELLRAAQRARTERYIAFLNAQLQAEQSIEVRTGLRALLLRQIQNRMLTNVDLPFAAKVLDGPSVEPVPGSPRVGRTLLIALVTGLGLGVLVVFLRAALR